jgi:hypothetical protein
VSICLYGSLFKYWQEPAELHSVRLRRWSVLSTINVKEFYVYMWVLTSLVQERYHIAVCFLPFPRTSLYLTCFYGLKSDSSTFSSFMCTWIESVLKLQPGNQQRQTYSDPRARDVPIPQFVQNSELDIFSYETPNSTPGNCKYRSHEDSRKSFSWHRTIWNANILQFPRMLGSWVRNPLK